MFCVIRDMSLSFTQTTAAKKYHEETVRPVMTKLQKILEQNNGGNGYFVGDEVSRQVEEIATLCEIM